MAGVLRGRPKADSNRSCSMLPFSKIISAHIDAIRSDPLPLDVETARWSPAGPNAQRLQKAPANDLKFQEFEQAAKNLLLAVTETEGECDEASCRTGIVAGDRVGAEHAASAGCMAS